ncbi:hypothetical protein GE09DRAFT_469523 [Coniochaeta sp. 2T2.1]|nr:hypothetical protein GE09DRAFT_469523 [Coniochaeta sp. 2T2.1]
MMDLGFGVRDHGRRIFWASTLRICCLMTEHGLVARRPERHLAGDFHSERALRGRGGLERGEINLHPPVLLSTISPTAIAPEALHPADTGGRPWWPFSPNELSAGLSWHAPYSRRGSNFAGSWLADHPVHRPGIIHTTGSTTSPPSAPAVSSRTGPRHCVQRRSLMRKEQPRCYHPTSEGVETRAGGVGSVAFPVPQRASILSRQPCNGDTSMPRGRDAVAMPCRVRDLTGHK